jgi:signal transduction histidine kinase
MFRGLRLRLTTLYALAALALVALVGGGAYLVVARYLRGVTDLALAHKMTHEFHALAAPIPPELVPADRDWSLVRGGLGLLSGDAGSAGLSERDAVEVAAAALGGGAPERVRLREEHGRWLYEVRFAGGARVFVERDSGRATVGDGDDRDDEGDEHGTWSTPPTPAPEATPQSLTYDAELAAIYVLPLDAEGGVLFDPNTGAPPLAPDAAALSAALANGSDLRTATTPDGSRVRLLTYRLTRADGPAALQLGRVLSDQDQVLRQLMLGLLALSAASVALIGAASWWLAGRALQPAQAAWERQQRFIASASHELRTPLTLIRASAEVALRGLAPADVDRRELLDDVLAESDHMRRLVDDLLTLTRLDSGRLPLSPADVDVAALLADTQRQAARLGDERGVAVSLGEAAGVARADPDRLRQVLLILVDNSLRHTPQGGSVRLTASPQGRLVHICVADTGCGIAPEHLPHIFERFYRADPARGREGGNAGLGLSIARGLVEAMGGQIGAESAVGRGTTVWMKLPAA